MPRLPRQCAYVLVIVDPGDNGRLKFLRLFIFTTFLRRNSHFLELSVDYLDSSSDADGDYPEYNKRLPATPARIRAGLTYVC